MPDTELPKQTTEDERRLSHILGCFPHLANGTAPAKAEFTVGGIRTTIFVEPTNKPNNN
jgi:hypothetical protein